MSAPVTALSVPELMYSDPNRSRHIRCARFHRARSNDILQDVDHASVHVTECEGKTQQGEDDSRTRTVTLVTVRYSKRRLYRVFIKCVTHLAALWQPNLQSNFSDYLRYM